MSNFHIRDCIAHVSEGSTLWISSDDSLRNALTSVAGENVAKRVADSVGIEGTRTFADHELANAAGIPLTTAKKIVAAREFGQLLAGSRRRHIEGVQDVLRMLPGGLANLDFEVMLGIAVDGRLGVKAVLLLAKGGAHEVNVTIRDLFVPLVRLAACGVILVHNHPGGNHTPSAEDVAFTNEMARAASLLGIAVHDHLIIAQEGITSFFESDLLPTKDEVQASTMARLVGGAE